MEQVVYGDLLFFVNFCMDFQCLFLTAKLLRRPFRLFRGVLASALGALYACAALFIYTSGPIAFFTDLAVCFLMCAMLFCGRGHGLLQLAIPFALYFGVSFAVGGVMSGMATLLSRTELPPFTGQAGSSLSFFLLALIGGLCTFWWGRLCQRRAKGARVLLTLRLLEKEITVTGLLDTGNLLTDPVGGRPVVILERGQALEWFPEPLAALVARGSTDLTALPQALSHRVRLIPAHTVTGKGLLLAISPDSASIDAGRGARAVELLVAGAPLSVPPDCKALLPAVLLTE